MTKTQRIILIIIGALLMGLGVMGMGNMPIDWIVIVLGGFMTGYNIADLLNSK